MKPNFVILFPVAQNVHLIKDIGQIANAVAEKGHYKSKLVCYQNSIKYDNLKAEASHLKIEFLKPGGKLLFMEKAVLSYLKSNAKNIEVLQLFHLTKESIYYGLYYLKHNKIGKIYLKMDVYNNTLEKEIIYSKKRFFQLVHKRKERKFLSSIKVISAENPKSLELLRNRFPEIKDKSLLVTNGINVNYVSKIFPERIPFNQKGNIILSVGRIGAEEKNYRVLIDAAIKCDLNNWKIVLVGPIENDFDLYVAQKIEENPHLKDKIELVGSIENRKELYQYYNQSKLFCLTSPFESFGIAFTEAMYFGNYVIGTDGMSSFDFITNNEQLGAKVPVNDVEKLTQTLNDLMKDTDKLSSNYLQVNQQVIDKFNWSKIVEPLIEQLK